MSADIRICSKPCANLNVLLVNSDRKPQESTQGSVALKSW